MRQSINTLIRVWTLSGILLSFYACGGSDSGEDTPAPEPIPAPGASTLTFPLNNEVCQESTSVSDTEGSVAFTWEASQNTDSYEVLVENLETGVQLRFTSPSTQRDITLIKGQPYSWRVISRATGTTQTGTSATWRFYLAGDGITWYAPFPPEPVAPQPGTTVTLNTQGGLTLEWSGTDPDGDLSHFELYVDTTESPTTLIASDITEMQYDLTGLAASTVYYWKVIAFDEQGNSSTSGTRSFKTAD